jgi:sigma-E factor negative regulatory protein RseC
MIEEQAIVVSVDKGFVNVETSSTSGCGSCQSSASCGAGLVSSLFGRKSRTLRIRNTVNARKGDTVTIGLNRLALVVASLMIYLLPLLMLIAGAITAITGEWLATALALNVIDLFSIIGGLAFAVLAFILSRRVLSTGAMDRMIQPVLLDCS